MSYKLEAVEFTKFRVVRTVAEDGDYFVEFGVQNGVNGERRTAGSRKFSDDQPDGEENDLTYEGMTTFHDWRLFQRVFPMGETWVWFHVVEEDDTSADDIGDRAFVIPTEVTPEITDYPYEYTDESNVFHAWKARAQKLKMRDNDGELDFFVEWEYTIYYSEEIVINTPFGVLDGDIIFYDRTYKQQQLYSLILDEVTPAGKQKLIITRVSVDLFLVTNQSSGVALETIALIEAKPNLEVTIYDGVPKVNPDGTVIDHFLNPVDLRGRVLRHQTFGSLTNSQVLNYRLDRAIYRITPSALLNGRPKYDYWKGRVQAVIVRRLTHQ
jgi:hypothetical protein